MIAVEDTGSQLRAVDEAKTSVTVQLEGWDPEAGSRAPPVEADATASGSVRELRLPPAFVRVRRADGERVATLGSDAGPVELDPGAYLLGVETNVRTKVGFEGAATVAKPDYRATTVRFPEPTAVTLGFESRLDAPPETVTVTPTPEGIAAALSALPAAHRTATPDRSFPSMRGHPPLVELGESVRVPASVRERVPATDLELLLPPERSLLFPAAPLAYYLGAAVRVRPDATPRIEGPGVDHALPDGGAFHGAAAALLRRVFLLDCLVRNAGPHGVDLDGVEHLDALELDAGTLYGASIPRRLAAYLDAPFGTVSDALPGWHLSLSVAPVDEHVPTLPHHLHRLAAIVPPASEPLPAEERLRHSLEDFYRGEGPAAAEPRSRTGDDRAVSVPMLKPETGPGRTHGWLAEGAPIDAYKALPEAYGHRLDYRERAGGSFSFVAVLNDAGMEAEHARAADIYRERAAELDIDIAVREGLDRAQLAEVFESRNDLVHYIGHCDPEGFRCADGHLSASSLSASNAQVFFLNACGSYYEGLELVRRGSVAGGVTFNRVLDEQAARVGTTFARLLVNGFSIARALRIARRRIMMGKDYTVVGDGTHVLTQASGFLPLAAELTRTGPDAYRLRFRSSLPYATGGHLQPHIPGHDRWYLFGSDPAVELDAGELRGLLDHADLPVVYDGDVYWPDALRERLA